MTPYLIVAGDFVQTGGMDVANLSLAGYLAEQGNEVHLVAHRIADSLAQHSNVHFHPVAKPLNSYFLGGLLLSRAGHAWAQKLSKRPARVIVNGGNCHWNDVNWVHYVHAAYLPQVSGNSIYRYKTNTTHRSALASEREVLLESRLVICNSQRTKLDLVEKLRLPEDRLHVVYYGTDTTRFSFVTSEEQQQARKKLGFSIDRPAVAFVGALGDRRKGFDILFSAWCTLCRNHEWDCDLVVMGTGAELSVWKHRVGEAGLDGRIKFLGFRRDVPDVLAACDLLVHPVRYEAYGLGVHEALCCGLPAIVTRSAGVAERYPPNLSALLLNDPPQVEDLVERLLQWRGNMTIIKGQAANLGALLRQHTWVDMARGIVELIAETKVTATRDLA